MAWSAEYDEDTGEHRIYTSDGELMACIGNASMALGVQAALAAEIASRGAEIALGASQRLETNNGPA